MFFTDAEIKTVNKKFDDLTQDDIVCSEETPTLHILSNVLDMLNFDLDRFGELVKGCLKGYNQFVCVGPYFNYFDKDERMNEFLSLMNGKKDYCETFGEYKLDLEKTWTAKYLSSYFQVTSSALSNIIRKTLPNCQPESALIPHTSAL